MGRNRVYEDQAERQKAYRERRRTKLKRFKESLELLREVVLLMQDLETFNRVHLTGEETDFFMRINKFLEQR